jgi:hypothetical protein
MRSLAIVKENIDNQRNAVQEERRLRVDNQPYGRADEAIEEIAFDNFAYQHSVIGSLDDLNAASVEDVASFFKTYYAPNNAVIAIVGDVNTASTLERARSSNRFRPGRRYRRPSTSASRRRTRNGGWRSKTAGAPPRTTSAIGAVEPRPTTTRSSSWGRSCERPQLFASTSTSCAGSSSPSRRRRRQSDQPRSPVVWPRSHAGCRRVADQLEQAIYSEIDGVKAGPIANSRWRRLGTRRSASSSEA